MDNPKKTEGYLSGSLLVAMPYMADRRFTRSVIYLCSHSADGAMGLVINRLAGSLTYAELLSQLDITPSPATGRQRVHFGGPVEATRGFVLHSADWLMPDNSMVINEQMALTSTTDVLRSIVSGQGPRHSILALGYAGWGAGQLDAELQANSWLHTQADENLLFDDDIGSKWQRAIGKIGVNPQRLSGEVGHA